MNHSLMLPKSEGFQALLLEQYWSISSPQFWVLKMWGFIQMTSKFSIRTSALTVNQHTYTLTVAKEKKSRCDHFKFLLCAFKFYVQVCLRGTKRKLANMHVLNEIYCRELRVRRGTMWGRLHL